ncbi:MAG: Gfo/Idh/MocA family oxidoreductase [Candidatus Omnitrophica bacterium]|nr:Gfo/Idh/MocA family oxidoreductase [Candidatus Omnitrophota bacterium]MCM8807997.1 Gfo/Idh/MocA family oxidoreductase [Candidatus Omnitrophota bacterium]
MEIKIGFIGCGGIGKAHMMRLSKIENVKLVAFCDLEENLAKECANLYNGNPYTDFRRMFDNEKIDACYICVPPFAHIGQEEECIERNIPFFIEKPIHLDLNKAKEIAKKIEEKKLITSVGYVLRYFDIVEQLKEKTKEEKIGLVRGKYYGEVPGEGKKLWIIRKDMSGGQLIEQATHIVDLMRYLCGEIEEVFAYKFEGINNKIYPEYNVEDALTLTMKFKNGIIGNLSCTWLWKGYDSEIEIIGKNVLFTYKGNGITINKGSKVEHYFSKIDPMYEEDVAFIKSVKENNPKYIKSNYNDGLKTLEVTLKGHESIEKNQPIKITS